MTLAPDSFEAEFTLLGPGFGESVIIHIGGGEWIIVDCCVKPSGGAAPLAYLESIGVGPDAVRYLVATHWHDDHVRGFGGLVEACPNAQVVQSAVLQRDELLSLVAGEDELQVRGPSGVREMRRTFDALISRGATPRMVGADTRLFDDSATPGHPSRELWSLSPSPVAVMRTVAAMAPPAIGSAKRAVPRPVRNPASVVLWIRVGDVCALLGADLECEAEITMGWQAIVRSAGRPAAKAHVLKVPHHGSSGADDEDVWHAMLQADPHAVLSPFRNGRVNLPTAEDKARIGGRTTNGWLTRGSTDPATVKRGNTVERTIREATLSFRSLNAEPGRVTLRCPANDPGSIVVDAPLPSVRL